MPTFNKYQKFLKTQMNGGSDTTGASTAGAARVVDFDTDTIKVMLVSSTYTPSVSGHATKADITNEVTGSNYTAGGATLSSVTLTESGGTTTLDAADVTWSMHASGFSNARYAIVYKDSGTASTSSLLGYLDMDANKSNVAGDFTLSWNASGISYWA